MQQIATAAGTTLSFDRSGSGPSLVLVHGSFSDHDSNWAAVRPLLEGDFHVHAVARRGRGSTTANHGHTLADEAADVAELIRWIGEPVFLLGHSYGARVALDAAAAAPERVRRLVLYEPPHATTTPPPLLDRLLLLADAGQWDEFTATFFRDGLAVPAEELEALRTAPVWPAIVADAPATVEDLRALAEAPFTPAAYRHLDIPVLLQIGTESPRDFFLTDALASALPDARIEPLEGQAHEGMSTAPEQYAEAVRRFLLR